MKAGTTALHDHLNKHPDIFMSKRKEPNYFAVAVDGELPPWVAPNDAMARRQMVLTKQKYMALFRDHPDELCGESSVLYLNDPDAARRAGAANPQMKAIAILREPAERAYSEWQFLQRLGREPMGFEEALDAESQRIMGPGYHYAGIGRYASAVKSWQKALGEDRVLAINYHSFVKDPLATSKEICEFLGVNPDLLPKEIATLNAWGGVPTNMVTQRIAALIRFVAADRVPPRWSQPLNRLWQKMFLDKAEPLEDRIAQRIRSDLLAETEELERMMGWELSSWKPAKVGA
jgi:hypothetical protein